MEKLNLIPILKNHIGKKFYSVITGDVELFSIDGGGIRLITKDKCFLNLDKYGYASEDGDCCLFPSKTNRDWGVWDETNNLRMNESYPKTWSDHMKVDGSKNETGDGIKFKYFPETDFDTQDVNKHIESVKALFKVLVLIDKYYGGIPDVGDKGCSINHMSGDDFIIELNTNSIVRFKNTDLAGDFMSYHENMELLKTVFDV